MMNLEDKKNNVLISIIILLCFIAFSTFAGYKLFTKKQAYNIEQANIQAEINAKKQAELDKQREEQEQRENATPTPELNLVTQNSDISIDTITNYDIQNIGLSLNGVNCTLPYTVNSMVSYGYLFRDKIAQDGYTYNQLSETLAPAQYSEFMDALSPQKQIIQVMIKNPYETEQMMINCDVYGISASTCAYGNSENEPSFVLDNGLYLGMTEGAMLKIMGKYDAIFHPNDDDSIIRYQWYQSIDGISINNILTCDIVNGYVQMISIEIG